MKAVHLTNRLITLPLTNGFMLVVNTLSGAIDIFEPETYSILEQLRAGHNPPPGWDEGGECRQLRERCYIFDSPELEQQWLDKLVQHESGNLPQISPMMLAVHVTTNCNLTCSYCYQDQDVHDQDRSMTEDMVEAAFVAGGELHTRLCSCDESPVVVLTGGEPLQPSLQPLVTDIIRRCRELNYKLDVMTDGVHINSYISTLQAAGEILDCVHVSMDGPAEVHDARRKMRDGTGTSQHVQSSIDAILSAGIACTVRVNIDRDNISHIGDLVALFEEKGWLWKKNFACHLIPITDHSQAGDHVLGEAEFVCRLQDMFRGEGNLLARFSVRGVRVLSRLAGSLDERTITVHPGSLLTHCEAAGRYYGFAPDGLIYPCPRSIGDECAAVGSFYPELKLDEYRMQAWSERTALTIDKCRTCQIATLCGGGCAYMALREHGDLGMPQCADNLETISDYLKSKKAMLCRGLQA